MTGAPTTTTTAEAAMTKPDGPGPPTPRPGPSSKAPPRIRVEAVTMPLPGPAGKATWPRTLDSRRLLRFVLAPTVVALVLLAAFRHDTILEALGRSADSEGGRLLPFLGPSQRLAPPRKPKWSVRPDGGDAALAELWRSEDVAPIWRSPSPYALDPLMLQNLSLPSPFAPLAYPGGEVAPDGGIDFCQPHMTWPGRPPTIVLRPYKLDHRIGHSLDRELRTHLISMPFAISATAGRPHLVGSDDGIAARSEPESAVEHVSDIGFLPWRPPEDVTLVPRIRDAGAPAYVNFRRKSDPLKNRIPPPPPLPDAPAGGDEVEAARSLDAGKGGGSAKRFALGSAKTLAGSTAPLWRTASCLSYDVPAAEDRIPTRPPPRFMFGMATIPSRIIRSLPVWEDWAASAPPTPELKPKFFVLTPPPTTSGDDADVADWERARDKLAKSPLNGTIRGLTMGRQEQRYFALVREMWKAETEGQEGAEGEARKGQVDWFVMADDDTYFMSLSELARVVVKYDPSVPRIVGGLSENPIQVNIFDHIAFGGAGILVNRAMMALLNKANFFDECFSRYGHLGGDGMISLCAASALRKSSKKVLTVDKTLRQFDVGGEAQGLFQAGLRMTSVHHWNSWVSLFPPHHITALHDGFQAVRLVGRAARAVGVANFGRRYVWGIPSPDPDDAGDGEAEPTPAEEKSTVVLALGFGLTIYAPGEVDASNLNQVEHTFSGAINLASRPSVREGTLKRSYYIVDARPVPGLDGVVLLRHANEDGELVDVVWDGRVAGAPPPERKGQGQTEEGLSTEALVGQSTGRPEEEEGERGNEQSRRVEHTRSRRTVRWT